MRYCFKTRILESQVPPPFITVATVGVMWVATRLSPSLMLENPVRYWPAFVLVLIGGLVSFAGLCEFKRHDATIDPRKLDDASVLVTAGVYRYTRNPMYLGIAIALCGVAWYLSNPLALVGVGAFILYITCFQIRPEERALISKFGVSGTDYIHRVRRWI